MKVLVLGGTRFFGIHMVNELLKMGHDVTIMLKIKPEKKPLLKFQAKTLHTMVNLSIA